MVSEIFFYPSGINELGGFYVKNSPVRESNTATLVGNLLEFVRAKLLVNNLPDDFVGRHVVECEPQRSWQENNSGVGRYSKSLRRLQACLQKRKKMFGSAHHVMVHGSYR